MSPYLPSGANPRRTKILWELGLSIANKKEVPYGGNRDICITVGSGAGDTFIPALRIATGSANLAHEVASGGLDMAFINPSAMLTQAYRGVGLFHTPLPLRIIASYPSFDRFMIVFRKDIGLSSLADVKNARYPLHVSVREDTTHSSRILIDQLFRFYDFNLAELESWGGRVHPAGPPGDKRRLSALREGTIDAVLDEGVRTWAGTALAAGFVPIQLDKAAFEYLATLGWHRSILRAGHFPGLEKDHACVDFSGWPLYARASLPDSVVFEVCAAFAAREGEMPWEDGLYEGLPHIFTETDSTPMDVPLHSGVERWLGKHKDT
jgi:TRAP-type uncharacterized transport system substrate-binding protein